MKSGLSKREKIMVMFAAALVIVFAGARFAIIPFYEDYTAKLEERERLVYQKEEMEYKLLNESLIRQNNQNARAELEDILQRYPIALSSYEADMILTVLCQNNDLNPISLGMSEPKPYEIKKTEAAQTDAADTPDAANMAQTAEKPPAFSVMTANMSLSGSYASLKKLLDEAEATDFLRITKLSYSGLQETREAGSPNMSVTFEITMLNELDGDISNMAN